MPEAIITRGAAATAFVGGALAPLVEAGDVVLLTGDLGAGKTVFAKGLAEGLGISDPITSPTFNILLVHHGRLPLYHFDLYRLDGADQLEDLDYWGTLEADGISVVEWGDRFDEALPAAYLLVSVGIADDDVRRITWRAEGARNADIARRWSGACEGLPGVRRERGEA